jgi:hypothetical protein
MAIYDCFMFNDEREILELRLRYLEDVVDFFVIAESQQNFSGELKEIQSDAIFEKLGIPPERIIRVNYIFNEEQLNLLFGPRGKYALERIARNSLINVINTLKDADYVILSDVDEIPTKNQLRVALSESQVCSLLTPLHYGKMNWLSPDGFDWNTVKVGSAKHFVNQDLNTFKYKRFKVIRANPGGHFSDQFRSVDEVLTKAKNSSHTEFNKNSDFQKTIFEYSQDYRINHFGRFLRRGMGLIEHVEAHQLNEIQRLAVEHKIFDFDFSKPEKTFLVRLLASYRVTKSWSNGILPSPVTKIPPLEFLEAIIEFTLSALKTKKRKLLHRIGLLRK